MFLSTRKYKGLLVILLLSGMGSLLAILANQADAADGDTEATQEVVLEKGTIGLICVDQQGRAYVWSESLNSKNIDKNVDGNAAFDRCVQDAHAREQRQASKEGGLDGKGTIGYASVESRSPLDVFNAEVTDYCVDWLHRNAERKESTR